MVPASETVTLLVRSEAVYFLYFKERAQGRIRDEHFVVPSVAVTVIVQ